MSGPLLREPSTLVIATILASASLLLLTIPKRNAFNLSVEDLIIIGLAFAIVGLLYRQITAWTIDMTQADTTNAFFLSRSTFVREFFFLLFLAIPIAAWAWIWLIHAFALSISLLSLYAIFLSIVIAGALTLGDWRIRIRRARQTPS